VIRSARDVIAVLEAEAPRLSARGVLRLGVFGSVARGEATEASDIDLVIEVADDNSDVYFETWDELEDLFGTKVDLVSYDGIRKELRPYIEPEILYAKGY